MCRSIIGWSDALFRLNLPDILAFGNTAMGCMNADLRTEMTRLLRRVGVSASRGLLLVLWTVLTVLTGDTRGKVDLIDGKGQSRQKSKRQPRPEGQPRQRSQPSPPSTQSIQSTLSHTQRHRRRRPQPGSNRMCGSMRSCLQEGDLAVYWQSPAAGAMRLTARGFVVHQHDRT
jgi:hypothetical protein